MDVGRNRRQWDARVPVDLSLERQPQVILPLADPAVHLAEPESLQAPDLAAVRLAHVAVGRGEVDVEGDLLGDLLLFAFCHGQEL